MDEEFIEIIQKRVVGLLKTLSEDLHVAAKDQCSEVVRLVGCWIMDGYPQYRVQVFKGMFLDGSSHDVLLVERGKVLFLLDPTIWQKYPESKSIFVGSASHMQEVTSLLEKKYGGVWHISESLQKCDESYMRELFTVIGANNKEV